MLLYILGNRPTASSFWETQRVEAQLVVKRALLIQNNLACASRGMVDIERRVNSPHWQRGRHILMSTQWSPPPV